MTRPSRPFWISRYMGFPLLVLSVAGCDKTDLSEYRPAGKGDQGAPTASESSDQAPVPSIADRDTSTSEPEPHQDSGEPETAPVIEADLVQSTSEQEPDTAVPPASALVPVNVISSVRELLSVPGLSSTRPDGSDSTPSTISQNAPTNDQPETKVKTNEIEVLVKEKKFQTESKTGALRVSFDDLDLLKVLNMEPVVENAVELMPDWLKGLDGKPVRIRGFMYPTYETEGIERFVLARDNQICCFGRDPKIYDLIQVDMKDGKTTNYIPATRAFDVLGTLRIKMVAPDGTPYGLYFIEQATVIDR